MDPQMPTSFIPKRVLDRPERPRARPTGLLLIVALFLLFVSGVIWGGALFYRNLLTSKVAQLEESVKKEKQNLDQATIVRFQRLDNRLRVAQDLLDKHVTLLPVFRLLEELTLPTIHYTSFDYTPKAITLAGAATSYEDIAVQTEVFAKDRARIQSFIFSDLDTNATGEVVFKLTLVPEDGLTSYPNSLTS